MNRVTTNRHRRLHRRALLRGAFGVSIALPWLEVFQRTAAAQQTDPLRLVVFIHANGVHAPEWFPDTAGPGYVLKNSLQPLAPFKDRMIVLSGVDTKSARKDKNGGSGHTVAGAHLLTGADTTSDRYSDRPSFDQELATHIGKDSAIKSLNTGVQTHEAAGGEMPRVRYSYSGNNEPVTPEHRPSLVFDQLSGFATPSGPGAQANADLIRQQRLSVLDFVDQDLQTTSGSLGTDDKGRLEEYLTYLRQMEVAVAAQVPIMCDNLGNVVSVDPLEDKNVAIITEQMLKMTQYAMQCDITRVGVFQIKGEQSYIEYSEIDHPHLAGVSGESHHNTSHHPNESIGKICKFHSQLVADFATSLDAVAEGSGSMLDNTIILYTNGICNGAKHDFENLPHVLIGGTKVLAGGQAAQFNGNATNNDLFLTLFQAFDVPVTTFGKPDFVTGVLPGLLA